MTAPTASFFIGEILRKALPVRAHAFIPVAFIALHELLCFIGQHAAAAAASADRSARKREAEHRFGAPQQMQRLGVRHFHRLRCAAQRTGLLDCVQQPQRTLTEKALAVLVVQIDPDDRTHNYHLRTKKLVVN